MMIPDVKTKVDRLPTDGITPEMLDAVLKRGNFRPKTDALLKDAKGYAFCNLWTVERQEKMKADPSYQYVGASYSLCIIFRAKRWLICFFSGIDHEWTCIRSHRQKGLAISLQRCTSREPRFCSLHALVSRRLPSFPITFRESWHRMK